MLNYRYTDWQIWNSNRFQLFHSFLFYSFQKKESKSFYIFFSKKNYGFISDGALSIDNALGIEANVGADINVTTNSRNINLNTSNGKINLGDTQLEPIPKGNKLVDILTELIDAITKQNYLTPSGPSKVGPENLPVFNSIKSKLKTILSELNSTS